jgi:hypothetical protein
LRRATAAQKMQKEMSKIDDQTVPAALARHLQPGEQLRHWAYGVKQLNIGLILLFYVTIGGALAVALMTKHYVIGLTDRRLLVVRVKAGFFTRCHLDQVVEVFDFPLHEIPRMKVKSSSGMLFSHFRIEAPNRTWVAKFHRMGMSRNHEQCAAIANVLGNPHAAMQRGGAPPPQLGGPPPAYGQPPYGAAPQAPWQGQGPYGGQPSYGQPPPPHGQAPHGQAPYGQAPYGQAPYGQPGYGAPQPGYGPPVGYGSPPQPQHQPQYGQAGHGGPPQGGPPQGGAPGHGPPYSGNQGGNQGGFGR